MYIMVVYDIPWYTKESYPIIEKELHYLWCYELAFPCPAGYQPAQLAKLVHHNHQHIIPINLRQVVHEINGTCVEFAIWNR